MVPHPRAVGREQDLAVEQPSIRLGRAQQQDHRRLSRKIARPGEQRRLVARDPVGADGVAEAVAAHHELRTDDERRAHGGGAAHGVLNHELVVHDVPRQGRQMKQRQGAHGGALRASVETTEIAVVYAIHLPVIWGRWPRGRRGKAPGGIRRQFQI